MSVHPPGAPLTRPNHPAHRRLFLWLGLLAVLLIVPLRFAPVHGSSMEPTLHEGDVVCFQVMETGMLPSLGDLVVFNAPTRPGKLFVKRLVGLPGDELRFARGKLRVNGNSISLPPGAVESGYSFSTRVPTGCFFAIGDHAEVSYDSRGFGPIRLDMLVGELLGY